MSDLIDRQKALDGLKYEMKYGAVIDQCGLDTAYDIIENIPSAEPERTAKVIRLEDGRVVCSACLEPLGVKSNYCRTCGSRLEKE